MTFHKWSTDHTLKYFNYNGLNFGILFRISCKVIHVNNEKFENNERKCLCSIPPDACFKDPVVETF